VIEFGGTTMGLDPIGTRPIDGQTPGTGGGTPPAAITDPLVVLVQITPGGPEQLVSFAGHALSVTHKANDFPSARVSLQLERDQLINVGTVSAPSLKRLDEYLRDDQVWIIKTARSDPQRDQELFRGHVRRVSRSLNVADGADIDLEFIGTQLDVHDDAWITGELRYAKADIDATSDANRRLRLAEGEPCVFNPGGVGNCYKHALIRTIDGKSVGAHPFWPSYSRDAQPWTWARVMAHVWSRAWLASVGEELGNGFTIDPERLLGGFKVRDWNLFEQLTRGEDQAAWLLNFNLNATPIPDAIEDPYRRGLLGKPVNFVIDCMSIWDALKYCCMQTGLGMAWEWRRGSGSAAATSGWGIRFFVADPGVDEQYGRRVRGYLPRSDWPIETKSESEIRAAANVESAVIAQDFGAATNAVKIVGRTTKNEVTVQLVPLWPPNAEWDYSSPSQIDAMVAASQGTTFRDKYATDGFLHVGDNEIVGRLWGLPEWPEFKEDLGRVSVHPFNATKYEIFDLFPLFVDDAPVAGRTHIRSRRFEPCVTARNGSSPMAPLIEVSIDSGVTWRTLLADVEVSPVFARIMLKATDLRSVQSREGTLNLADAYIRGTMRLRITAGIRSDFSRISTPWTSIQGTLSRRRRAVAIRNPGAERWRRASSSRFFATNFPVVDRDDNDGDRLTREAIRKLWSADRVQWPTSVQLVDLVMYEESDNSGYRIGDVFEGIYDRTDGADGKADIVLRVRDKYIDASPVIGALIGSITWTVNLGQPLSGGLQVATQLTLDTTNPVALLHLEDRT
jgi:hypothetical protein